jgi:hypothetical protein
VISLYTVTTYGCREYLRRIGLITEGELTYVEAPRAGAITIDEIQTRVAEHFQIPKAEMTSARRARDSARPRQVAMYLAKQLTPRSMPEIGRKFGGRDHTTVIHAVRQVEKLRQLDAEFNFHVSAVAEFLSKRKRSAPAPRFLEELPDRPVTLSRAWCDQCSRVVHHEEAARCASPWCKGKEAIGLREEAAQ